MRQYDDPFEALLAETTCEIAEEMRLPQEQDFRLSILLDISPNLKYISVEGAKQ